MIAYRSADTGSSILVSIVAEDYLGLYDELTGECRLKLSASVRPFQPEQDNDSIGLQSRSYYIDWAQRPSHFLHIIEDIHIHFFLGSIDRHILL